MARGIVALGDEDIVVFTALDRLVQRNGREVELLQEGTESLLTKLELLVGVGVVLGDGGNNSDVLVLGADVMGRPNDGDVDI